MPSKPITRAFHAPILSLAGAISVAVGLGLMGSLARAETPGSAAEVAFRDVLSKVEVPDDVQPIPGAVNEEFRNCRAEWPEEYEISQKGPEARAYRDIYGFVKARNVIATQDCTCTGKVADWSEVEALADQIRKRSGVKELRAAHTEQVHDAAEPLRAAVEKLCGGKF